MDNYMQKTSNLITKFAKHFASLQIDGEFKDDALTVFKSKLPEFETVTPEDKTFADLRMVLFKNGEVQRIFPSIPTANKKDFDNAHAVIKNFAAYEASALAHFFKKDNYKIEDLKEFISVTYRPKTNNTGNDSLLSVYFIISVFIFANGEMEYTVKPNIQYILTEDKPLTEEALIKLMQ